MPPKTLFDIIPTRALDISLGQSDKCWGLVIVQEPSIYGEDDDVDEHCGTQDGENCDA